MLTVKHMNRGDNMFNMYNFRIGEYHLIVRVNRENIRLSFSKDSNKGVKEYQLFMIPLLNEQDKSEFTLEGGEQDDNK